MWINEVIIEWYCIKCHPVLLCVVYCLPSSDTGVFTCIANILELAPKENKSVLMLTSIFYLLLYRFPGVCIAIDY